MAGVVSALAVRVGSGRSEHAMTYEGDEETARLWATRNGRQGRSITLCGRRGGTPTGLGFDATHRNACGNCLALLNGAS